MLTTLIKGVEGGLWFRLFDKVFAERNLSAEVAWVSRTRQHLILDRLRACITEDQNDETEWLEGEKTIKETSSTI